MPPTIHDQCDTHDDTQATVAFMIDARLTGHGLLRVGGEIDVATTPLLRTTAHSALAEWPGQIHLDLGEVTFIDCAGVGVLIGLRNAALLAGAATPRITASRPVRRLMRLTGVDNLFDLDPPACPSPHGEKGES